MLWWPLMVNPVILAFGGLSLSLFRGSVSGSSTSGTRVVVNPDVEETSLPKQVFAAEAGSVLYIPARFTSEEQIENHLRDSYPTTSELNILLSTDYDVDAKYRCVVTVRDIDQQHDWAYRACVKWSRDVAYVDESFWCEKDELLSPADTTFYSITSIN